MVRKEARASKPAEFGLCSVGSEEPQKGFEPNMVDSDLGPLLSGLGWLLGQAGPSLKDWHHCPLLPGKMELH